MPGAYRGRFAPSPTGPLHLGSLVAALASFLEARARGGEWLVRIEDLDPPREAPGAADGILRTLDALGLHWDGEVMRQATRGAAYEAALGRLAAGGHLYPCRCSRREMADGAVAGIEGPVYPGTCRERPMPLHLPAGEAVRVRTGDAPVAFVDAVQGPVSQVLSRDVGDFVLRRADGLWAYQLAVVVDDAAQGVTDVVRGADLLASTPRQAWLQRLLGLPTPRYAHVSVVVDAGGEKLSKQTGAGPVDVARGADALHAALRCLGHPPPAALARGPSADVLEWARAHWRLEAVPRSRTVPRP